MEQALERKLTWLAGIIITLELLVTQWLAIQLADSPAAISSGVRNWAIGWAILILATLPMLLKPGNFPSDLPKMPFWSRGLQYVAAVPMALGYLVFYL